MAMICGAMRWTDGGRGNREEGEKDEGAVENGFDSIDFFLVSLCCVRSIGRLFQYLLLVFP